MKKITIFALFLGYGGIEKYISDLCKMLHNDYEIEIVSTYKSNIAFDIPKNVKITYLINDISNRKELISSLKQLNIIKFIKEACRSIKILSLKKIVNVKYIKNMKTDYVITTRIFHNKLINKYASNNIIKIASDHNYHNNNIKYINDLKNSISNFDYFICISKKLYNDYKDKFKPKCIYIPNVIEKSNTYSKLSTNRIISVGRLEKVKGYEDAIKTAYELKQNNFDFTWNIVGNGSQKEYLQKLIKEYSLEKNVYLLGFKNQEELKKIYNESDLFVCTSLSESFGIVLLEAMSHKIPCITFETAKGACEIIDNNDLIIENRNIKELSNKILELLNDKNKLINLGEESLNKCNDYYIENVKKEWLKLIGEDK